MDKKETKLAEGLLGYSSMFIKSLPINKQEFISSLSAIKDEMFSVVMIGKGEWNKSRAVNVSKTMSDDMWTFVLKGLEREIQKSQAEEQMKNILLGKIREKYPNTDVYIRELVCWYKNSYGIKVYIFGFPYLFEFEGTLIELADELCAIIKWDEEKEVACPFCKHSKPKHSWYETPNCVCGADIVIENSRPNDLHDIMKEVGGIRIIPKNENKEDWAIWFLNKEANEKFDKIIEKEK